MSKKMMIENMNEPVAPEDRGTDAILSAPDPISPDQPSLELAEHLEGCWLVDGGKSHELAGRVREIVADKHKTASGTTSQTICSLERMAKDVNELSENFEKISTHLWASPIPVDIETVDAEQHPLWDQPEDICADDLAQMADDADLRPQQNLLLRAQLVDIAVGLIWKVFESTEIDGELNECVEDMRRLAFRLATKR